MKLYEINEAIESAVDTETGEVLDAEKLEALNLERDVKIENIACWIKNLESDARELAEEVKHLQERKQAKERKIESLKNYLAGAMPNEKFETARVRIGWRASEVVEIENEEQFIATANESLLKFKTEINKQAVKELLKDGVEVKGASLIKKNNIQIK